MLMNKLLTIIGVFFLSVGLASSVSAESQTTKQNENLERNKIEQSVAKPVSSIAVKPKEKVYRMVATAYTAYCKGCSGITKTGINLRKNPDAKVVAVDPKVIPLGSKVWVEGYGNAVAGDIGSAIKGKKIDIYVKNKKTAYQWGRRTVTVKVFY